MLLFGFAAVSLTATALLGGYLVYEYFWSDGSKDDIDDEVPVLSYYSDAEWLEEPQADVKYLIDDDTGIDANLTLNAVMDWVETDDPNIWTGDWNVKVYTWNDSGLVHISGDASTIIKDRYENVELPYFTGEGFTETATVDLEFA